LEKKVPENRNWEAKMSLAVNKNCSSENEGFVCHKKIQHFAPHQQQQQNQERIHVAAGSEGISATLLNPKTLFLFLNYSNTALFNSPRKRFPFSNP